MIWYQALVPAALIAIAVRLEAIFFLPYWSWLQLIPEPQNVGLPSERKKKNQALVRRTAIPLLMGVGLVTLWPDVYGLGEVGLVSALGAGLLLWPLFFASFYFDEARSPAWLAWILYALLPVVFAASGSLGAFVGEAIAESGGILGYLKSEVPSWLLPAILVVFANAGFDRASSRLARNRQREYLNEDQVNDSTL